MTDLDARVAAQTEERLDLLAFCREAFRKNYSTVVVQPGLILAVFDGLDAAQARADHLDQEREKALAVLATQSGDDLEDACRQVKQVAISEADNSQRYAERLEAESAEHYKQKARAERAETKLTALTTRLGKPIAALRQLGSELNLGAHIPNIAEQIWDRCDDLATLIAEEPKP